MTIDTVTWDNRKDEFVVCASESTWYFPFARLRVAPSPLDRIVEAAPDPELGGEAFTYRLESGAEDSVHLDAVRAFNRDPEMIQQLIMHRLTVSVREAIKASSLGRQQMARYLGTSPAQLYRLLDPDNAGKSIGQMISLLNMLGKEVDLLVSDDRPETSSNLSSRAPKHGKTKKANP